MASRAEIVRCTEVGDEIYTVEDGEVHSYRVDGFDRGFLTADGFCFSYDMVGSEWFLTRRYAEKAREDMNDERRA